MLERFKQMWLGWQGVAKGILFAQNFLLMAVAYLFGLGPVALGMRLFGTKLLDNGPPNPGAKGFWVPRSPKPMTMDEASRQF